MIRKLEQSANNVLGYKVEGKLTEVEFKAFSEEFEAEISRRGKVRLLIQTAEIPSIELGALWEDLKLSRYRDNIERYALVGESALLEWGASLGDALIGGEVKHFDSSRYEEAVAGAQR